MAFNVFNKLAFLLRSGVMTVYIIYVIFMVNSGKIVGRFKQGIAGAGDKRGFPGLSSLASPSGVRRRHYEKETNQI